MFRIPPATVNYEPVRRSYPVIDRLEVTQAGAATEAAVLSPQGCNGSVTRNMGVNVDRSRPGKASGIGDQDVAKKVAKKKASIPHHARACEKKKQTGPEHTVFSGDAPCPKCKTLIWVEWQNTTVAMACPKCGFRFDQQQAIAFLSAHDSDDNYKAEAAAQAAEATDVLERAKAVLAKHEASSADHGTNARNDPLYGDCAHCGKPLNLTGVASDESVDCPHCRTSHGTKAGVLNHRNTPQRVDPRGWFGRLFLGSGLQKSAAERRAEDRAVLVDNIETLRRSVQIAERQQDFQRATFYQRKLELAERRLEEFDNGE
ncbi:hypothetical protein [Limnoglobus roseus]|uniref:Uncharacterized protein n=1 Tax=Limnoglobus roseus TaxID=2598579 RepID=A0A5C1AIN5_9BACT|nr:hypothetical protein [Limnoglobus roseus]QEL17866.1 hypothetical protein PX52LOC_04877 [Limnoglobus roseus]